MKKEFQKKFVYIIVLLVNGLLCPVLSGRRSHLSSEYTDEIALA